MGGKCRQGGGGAGGGRGGAAGGGGAGGVGRWGGGVVFFFSSRRRHTRFDCDWSSDVCSSDLRSPIVGIVSIKDPAQLMPLLTMPTIGDRLSAKGISWAWYSGGWNDAVAGHPDEIGRASCRERV